MSHLAEFIKAFVPHIASQQERDEAYLNQSVDIFDVERRMLEIDSRPSTVTWQMQPVTSRTH
jgi:Protein of unknown function (DUF3563)